MDTYLLRSEDTRVEALLTSTPTTSKLFSKITPHESTDSKLETYLTKDLMKNFRFEQALYCAVTEPFLRRKDFNQYYIRSESSEEFGEQSIYGLKEKISLDILDKIILLDGHHRFSVINKYFIDKQNEVPIMLVYFQDLNIEDHYFSGYRDGSSENVFTPAFNAGYGKGNAEDYDLVTYHVWYKQANIYESPVGHLQARKYNPQKKGYLKNMGKNTKSRFAVRDEILSSPGFKFKPSKPPYLSKGRSGDGMDHLDIYFAAKAPTKEELLSGEVFPTKSTWITPKFNPDLYREYLN